MNLYISASASATPKPRHIRFLSDVFSKPKYTASGLEVKVTPEYKATLDRISWREAERVTRPALKALNELISWDNGRAEKAGWTKLSADIKAIMDRDWSTSTWDEDKKLLNHLWFRLDAALVGMVDAIEDAEKVPRDRTNRERLGSKRWMVDDVERLRDAVEPLFDVFSEPKRRFEDGKEVQLTPRFRKIINRVNWKEARTITRPALEALNELISWDTMRAEKEGWTTLAKDFTTIMERNWAESTWDSDMELLESLWSRLNDALTRMIEVVKEIENVPTDKDGRDGLDAQRCMVDDFEKLVNAVAALPKELQQIKHQNASLMERLGDLIDTFDSQ
ncbi:hypothetical protein FRB90_006752 [Tulasnella sp. 427]|nr:hypothetical protein FRB90_006752 [Tulasnella sp. 427]